MWAAAADGSGNRKLYNVTHSGDEVLTEWVSPDTFFVYSWTAIGWQNVRLINVTTGEVRRVGPDFPVQTLAYDPQTQTQLYYGDDFTLRQQGLTGGLYLSRPNSTSQGAQFITSGDWYETRWLPQVRLFFARGREGLISVGLDGRVTKYEVGQNMPAESPNGAWLLGWSYGEVNDRPGLRLYTSAGQLARTITSDSVLFATWSPDSMGAFYVSKGTLQYVTIPDGEPQMVAEKLLSSEPASYVWVRR